MKYFLRTALLSLAFFSLGVVTVHAQEAASIEIYTPDSINLDEDTGVTIELLDENRQPVVDSSSAPQLTFDPSSNVDNITIYDCVDETNEATNCTVNNRGIPGIYEVFFRISNAPVTLTVEVDGVTSSVVLGADIDSQPSTQTTESTPTEPTPVITAGPEDFQPEGTEIDPATIQVGPGDAPLYLFLTLVILGLVLSTGIIKQSEY